MKAKAPVELGRAYLALQRLKAFAALFEDAGVLLDAIRDGRREQETLRGQVEPLRRDVARLKGQVADEQRKTTQAVQAERDRAGVAKKEADRAIAAAGARRGRAEEEATRAERRIQTLEEQGVKEAAERKRTLQAELDAITRKETERLATLKRTVAELESRIADGQRRLESLRAAEREIQGRAAVIAGRTP